MGTSSARFTDPETKNMSNRNRRTQTNDNVIDLTESFTLADHDNLNNVVISLDTDDSIRDEQVVIPRPSTPRRVRKRRHSRTRATITLETSVVDLSTPECKKQPNNKKSAEAVTIDEPSEKRAKRTIGSCAICFDEFAGQELASTKCGHIFCLPCLEQALKYKADPRCPTCRTPLKGRNRYHPIFL